MRIKDIADINQKVLSENTPKNFMFRYIDISSVDSNGNISESEPLYFGDAPSRARRVLRVNDIIISTVRTYLKAIAFISPNYKDYIASTGFAVLTPKKDVNPNYIYYGLINNDFIDEVSKNSIGVSYPAITSSELSSLSVPLPSLPVQRRIVSYLDSKTSEIDHAISLLEQKREAYTRLKASVINRAVTRGLNPNVKIKDSGVEWIGKIPEGWEVKRLKSIFTESKAVSSTGKEDLLSVSEYYGVAKRVDKMEDGEYISRAETLVGYKKCKKDDLVINIMLAWKRGLGFSDYDGIVSPSYAVYRGKNIVPHYFHYLLRTNMYIAEFKRNSKGIIDSRLRLYTDRFNNIKAVVPPLPEQRSIASYLDAECSKIDRAASIVEKQIDAYKRLKRSLINEVVTGKRTKF